LNLLARANRELNADFDLSSFLHRAPYNEYQGRIEMHLVSTRPQVVHLNSHEFYFARGEHITTEYSYKYSVPGFANLAKKAGFELVKSWEDAEQLFSVMLLRVKPRSWRKSISPASRGAVDPILGGQELNDDTILETVTRQRYC